MKKPTEKLINDICEMYFGGSTLTYQETARILNEEGYQASIEDVEAWVKRDLRFISTPTELDGAGDYGAPIDGQCSVANCTNKQVCKGLCQMHYSRNRRHGSPHILLKTGRKGLPQKDCKIEGCNKAARTAGLCPMHYNRLRRHGSPHKVNSYYFLSEWERFNKYLTPPDEHGCQFWLGSPKSGCDTFSLSDRTTIKIKKYYYEYIHKIKLPPYTRLISCCKLHGAEKNNNKCVVHTMISNKTRRKIDD